jgi:arylsulfatase A-like enzyme
VLIQISEDTVGRALRTRRWKYGVTATHLDGTKYSTSDRYEETFLYDLQSDPYELVNLINFSSHDAVRASLRKRLIKRIVESGENAPTISPAESSSEGIDQRLVFDNEILE